MRGVLIIAGYLLLSAGTAGAADLVGTARVIDGETLEVAGQEVRLFGIDAPEPDQTCRWPNKEIPCGRVAATALMDLVAGARVECRLRGEKRDGLEVASCDADGFDLSGNMVHTGWALADRGVSEAFVATEENARAAKRGLWRGEFVPPWEWRQGKR